jgi:hypothetical protein
MTEVEELREELSFIYKWIERGIFDKHVSASDALGVIAHYPGAPWKNGRWDVDHKEYANKFYEQFPKARAPASDFIQDS